MDFRKCLTIISLMLLLSAIANAQQRSSRANVSGLLVETIFLKTGVPSYQPVTHRDSQVPKGVWSSRFKKIEGWQLPEGEKRILAVRVYPYFVNDVVTVEVAVLRGEKHIDDEDAVATYTLRGNEKVSVEELRNFGIEPIQLRLFRSAALPSNLPAIENNTQSLEVVGIEPIPHIFPSYKLTFRNVSNKSIQAMMLQVKQGERLLSTGMPQGLEGKPLIAPGDSIEWRMQLSVRPEGAADNKVPAVIMNQRIVIPGVRFIDGSVEGVFNIRTDLKAEQYGRKLELQRLIPLLEAAMAEADTNDGSVKLRARIERLSFEFTNEEISEIAQKFTPDQRTADSIKAGRHLMRNQVLEQLRSFPTDATLFRQWLVKSKESYTNYLLRLETSVSGN